MKKYLFVILIALLGWNGSFASAKTADAKTSLFQAAPARGAQVYPGQSVQPTSAAPQHRMGRRHHRHHRHPSRH